MTSMKMKSSKSDTRSANMQEMKNDKYKMINMTWNVVFLANDWTVVLWTVQMGEGVGFWCDKHVDSHISVKCVRVQSKR